MTAAWSEPLCLSRAASCAAAARSVGLWPAAAEELAVGVAPAPAEVVGPADGLLGLLLRDRTATVATIATRAAPAIARISGLRGRVILPKVSGRFWSATGDPSGPNWPPGPYGPGWPYCPPGPPGPPGPPYGPAGPPPGPY